MSETPAPPPPSQPSQPSQQWEKKEFEEAKKEPTPLTVLSQLPVAQIQTQMFSSQPIYTPQPQTSLISIGATSLDDPRLKGYTYGASPLTYGGVSSFGASSPLTYGAYGAYGTGLPLASSYSSPIYGANAPIISTSVTRYSSPAYASSYSSALPTSSTIPAASYASAMPSYGSTFAGVSAPSYGSPSPYMYSSSCAAVYSAASSRSGGLVSIPGSVAPYSMATSGAVYSGAYPGYRTSLPAHLQTYAAEALPRAGPSYNYPSVMPTASVLPTTVFPVAHAYNATPYPPHYGRRYYPGWHSKYTQKGWRRGWGTTIE